MEDKNREKLTNKMGLGEKKANYIRLKKLISQDEVLLLIHKRYKGLHKLLVYILCGLSFRYFERAYEKGDIILQLREIGPRIGSPLSWQEVLNETENSAESTTATSIEYLREDSNEINTQIKDLKAKIKDYKDYLFGATLFYEETKLIWPSSLLKGVKFEEHYRNIMHRGEVIINRAEKILGEVKINHNINKFKDIEFPPLEKDMILPDNIPHFKLLVETYNELFPGRNRRVPLTKEEHKLIMNKVMDKF